jgi:peroxiredoxin family protein
MQRSFYDRKVQRVRELACGGWRISLDVKIRRVGCTRCGRVKQERLARDGDPVEIYDFLKLLKKTGNVNFCGCRLAAATFEVNDEDLIPEADGIVDSVWFVNEKAVKADHCQYF